MHPSDRYFGIKDAIDDKHDDMVDQGWIQSLQYSMNIDKLFDHLVEQFSNGTLCELQTGHRKSGFTH